YLHRAAAAAVDRVLRERLVGAGQSAAALLARGAADAADLRAVMQSNELDAAYVVTGDLRVVADASGASGRRADLLRVDARRVGEALAGSPSVVPGYALGTLTVMTGYFPVAGPGAAASAADRVLVLEAGQVFVAAHRGLARARNGAGLLALLSTLALAVVAARLARAERSRQHAAARAARGELLSRVAAMAAHEIRNPLGVIRGTIDLMRERSAAALSERDRQSLADIGGEVERLRRLTDDLLSLASDRPLALAATDVAALLDESARATEAAFPGIAVRRAGSGPRSIDADPQLLRQVLRNLLSNAAQAQGEGEIAVAARDAPRGGGVEITVSDSGPGVPADVGDRVFDLYFTTKSGGTGLGLAIARRIVERHGGALALLPAGGRPGATFIVTLPARPPVGDNPQEESWRRSW
ncbi:MAG TPA: HAMP domain-containing sensor histidine kinase, partial [Polyangia bacterium]|nr:HAMP domain-containing sensor histidine kinase [Polyangia bacterium]